MDMQKLVKTDSDGTELSGQEFGNTTMTDIMEHTIKQQQMDKPTVYILQQDITHYGDSGGITIVEKGEEVTYVQDKEVGNHYLIQHSNKFFWPAIVENNPKWFLSKEPAKAIVNCINKMGDNNPQTHGIYISMPDPDHIFTLQETDNLTAHLNGQWLDIPECRQDIEAYLKNRAHCGIQSIVYELQNWPKN